LQSNFLTRRDHVYTRNLKIKVWLAAFDSLNIIHSKQLRKETSYNEITLGFRLFIIMTIRKDVLMSNIRTPKSFYIAHSVAVFFVKLQV